MIAKGWKKLLKYYPHPFLSVFKPSKAILRHRAVKILSLLLLVALVSVQLLWQPSAIKQSVKLSQIKSPKLSHKKPAAPKDEKKKSSKPASSRIHEVKQEKIHIESPTRPPPEPSTLKATTTKEPVLRNYDRFLAFVNQKLTILGVIW